MRSLRFKFCKSYLDEDPDRKNCPCLVAKLKNSQLKGMASQVLDGNRWNPDCIIRMRAVQLKRVTAWQRKMLDKLFSKNGLALAVAEGMRDYETNPKFGWEGYDVYGNKRKELVKFAITAFMIVTDIFIDEIQNEVVIQCATLRDINISEHGAAIYLKRGRWRFGFEDYVIGYKERVRREDMAYEREYRKQRERRERNADLSEMEEIKKWLTILEHGAAKARRSGKAR